MGGRQGRARELQNRDSAASLGLRPQTPNSVQEFLQALEKACASIPGLKGRSNVLDHFSRQSVEELCNRYWLDWTYSNSPALADARSYVKKVKRHLLPLYELVDRGDQFANDAMATLSPEWKMSISERVDALEFWLLACDEILASKVRTGPRQRHHMDATVGALIDKWEAITGREFKRNWEVDDKRLSFLAPGSEFIRQLVVAIDREATIAKVSSSMRRVLNR